MFTNVEESAIHENLLESYTTLKVSSQAFPCFREYSADIDSWQNIREHDEENKVMIIKWGKNRGFFNKYFIWFTTKSTLNNDSNNDI